MKIYNFKDNPYDLAFKYILDNYKKENKINQNTTIIYPGFDKDIISISNLLKDINNKLIVVTFNNLSDDILNVLNSNNNEIITIPHNLDIEELVLMSNDLKLDIENSVIINLFEEKLSVSAYFKNSKEIYEEYKKYNLCYIELKFGIFTGIAKYIKMMDLDNKVIGIKKVDYDSKIIDLDFFDEIIDSNTKINENSLFIKI